MKHVCVCAENGRPTEDLLEPRAAELGARGAAGGQARRRRGRRARGAAPRAAGNSHARTALSHRTHILSSHLHTRTHTNYIHALYLHDLHTSTNASSHTTLVFVLF